VRAQHERVAHHVFDMNKFFNRTADSVTFTANASRLNPKACQALAGTIPVPFAVDYIHAN
ncbi:MAG TPA: hypothetical protein PLR06_00420, partial [Cyclobacteriaceae bacterium]|nr:hypothetical protein [Cyclobacteriaceae bacterium]